MNELTARILAYCGETEPVSCRPEGKTVAKILEKLRILLFPEFLGENDSCAGRESYISMLLQQTIFLLEGQILSVMGENGRGQSRLFLGRLPALRRALELDLEAFLAGDPAAESAGEVVASYPGFYAITVQRLAHELYGMGVPVLPRMMTELAHSATGIDIHPGAQIGTSFFIDHGTGVVIGQTAVIGDYVKIYQGVTLGALSTRGGRGLQGKKRHPTIEDRVTVYANAAILGGGTVVGHDSVIGASVFITESVEPGSVRGRGCQITMDS